jgi:Flp pilus assembly CpaE family ATPase
LSIALVTALVNAENEDRIIASLIADGFTLEKRCHSVTQLRDFLSLNSTTERLLIIADEEFGLLSQDVSTLVSEQRALLQVPAHTFLSSEEILFRSHEAVRQPVAPILQLRVFQRRKNFVAITGSTGSPGITTVALNLATELSAQRSVQLIDGDPQRRDLYQRIGLQNQDTSALTARLSVASIDYMNTTTALETRPETIVCIDIGDAPPLKELVKDRRKLGRDFLESFQLCSHVVYVAQSENYSLAELDRFREAMKECAPDISIVWILNKIGKSTRQKTIQRSFSARISGDQEFHLPREHAVLDRAQGQYSTLMEVAPRSALRRAIKELSIYLDNLI